MEIASLLIAIFALLFSLYTYLVHDMKIKQQDKLINEYNIEKIKTEKIKEKKAFIEAYVIEGPNGNKIIKVYNSGKSVANNVIVTIPESDGYQVKTNLIPIEILPAHNIDIEIGAIRARCPSTIIIDFDWDDMFQQKNKASQTIQIGNANNPIISRINIV